LFNLVKLQIIWKLAINLLTIYIYHHINLIQSFRRNSNKYILIDELYNYMIYIYLVLFIIDTFIGQMFENGLIVGTRGKLIFLN